MQTAGSLLVLRVGDAGGAWLDEAVRGSGFRLRDVGSLEEAIAGSNGADDAPTALCWGAADAAAAREACRRVSAELPDALLIVAGPAGANGSPDLSTGNVLWLAADGGHEDQSARVSAFLQEDGLQWAGQMARSTLRGRLRSQPTARDGGGDGERRELADFARRLSGFTELGPMLDEALRCYLGALWCEAGSLYLWDERTETLILRAAEGPDREERLGLRQKLGEGLAGCVAARREPLLVTDARRVPWLEARRHARYPSFSCVGAPVIYGDQLFGVVCVTMPREREAFTQDDVLLVQGLSKELGALVHPLSLLSDLRYFNDRLVQVFRSCSTLVLERDEQVEALRLLSSDILDGIPLGVLAYDLQMRVCFANSAAEALLEAAPVRLMGTDACDLAAGFDVPADDWAERVAGVVREGTPFRLERVKGSWDEGTRVFEINGAALHGSDGGLLGGVLLVQDVTSDVELEAKLSSAQKLAMMGQIAAKVAHELNNPLDGILRFLGLANRLLEDDPDRARDYLDESRQALVRMGNIVRQLLEFSRRHPGSGGPVGIGQMVRDALALYEDRAVRKDAELDVDLADDLPASPHMELCDVFGNVVKNALDAMDPGGRLRVRAWCDDGFVRITFEDTGPGVPEDLRESIFEPFFTTKRDGTGTGLGLATCRDTLERLGGHIRLRPSEQGAAFEVQVPAGQCKQSISGGSRRDG